VADTVVEIIILSFKARSIESARRIGVVRAIILGSINFDRDVIKIKAIQFLEHNIKIILLKGKKAIRVHNLTTISKYDS